MKKMKKKKRNTKKTIAFFAIAVAMAFVASVGMASAVTLLADQNINAGTVTVSESASKIYITYETIDGWKLTAYHLYVSYSGPPTTSAPGRFPFKGDADPATTSITVQTIESRGEGEPIFIAAHAELEKYLYTTADGVEVYQSESGWGEGTQIRANKNWAMYFKFIPGDR